jgi:hypothetical protein
MYQVVAANAFGSVTSVVVHLLVEIGSPGFVFLDLPASQTVFLGHVIQLHVAPSGTAPFTYQWQRNGVNVSDDYRTAGSQTDTLTIGYAGYPDSANYHVIVTGTSSALSTVDALTVTTNGSSFFNASGNAADWSLQGTTPPVLTSANGTNTLQLTAGLGNTDRSAFLNVKQTIGSFQATFVYQDVSGAGGADGVSFCIQNQAVNARGAAGGGLGVGGITPSAELELNIYAPNTRGFAFNTGGAVVPPFTSLLPNLGIGDNANPVRVELNYNGTVLTAKFTDVVTSGTFTTNMTVNIPTIVGANTAWVGFTGADGGVASTQTVSWGQISSTRVAIAVQRVGNNLVLTWPAASGAYLQSTPTVNPSLWNYDNVDTFRVVGTNSTVTIPPQSAGQYYRLQLFP